MSKTLADISMLPPGATQVVRVKGLTRSYTPRPEGGPDELARVMEVPAPKDGKESRGYAESKEAKDTKMYDLKTRTWVDMGDVVEEDASEAPSITIGENGEVIRQE